MDSRSKSAIQVEDQITISNGNHRSAEEVRLARLKKFELPSTPPQVANVASTSCSNDPPSSPEPSDDEGNDYSTESEKDNDVFDDPKSERDEDDDDPKIQKPADKQHPEPKYGRPTNFDFLEWQHRGFECESSKLLFLHLLQSLFSLFSHYLFPMLVGILSST